MTDSYLTLRFVREPKITSDIIAWFSQGTFSHVEAIWPDDPAMTFGSYEQKVGDIPPGVQFRPLGYHRVAACTHFHIPATQAQMNKWKTFMLAQKGKPYDWAAIWGFATGRNWRDPGQWICSQLQARGAELAPFIGELCEGCNKITPVALALVISALPGVIREAIK